MLHDGDYRGLVCSTPAARRTETDRNPLYVACTRAMHRLTLYSLGDPSAFLPANAQG